MAKTGNKGEWSEIYVLLKLLGEGKMYAGNHNLERIQDLFYPIVKILRREVDGEYHYLCDDSLVIVQTADGEEVLKIEASVLIEKASYLLNAIKMGSNAFEVPQIEEFMNDIHCHSLKAKSSDKTDIHIVLHDRRTKLNSEMGYSIKSQLGGDSTLLNAGKNTNFVFKAVGVNFSNQEIEEINSISTKTKVRDRYNAIINKGASLAFERVANEEFRANLMFLDSDLQQVIASILLAQLKENKSMLKDLTSIIGSTNPLHYPTERAESFYQYKLKNLLTSVALGMMPSKPWNGKYDANGGYLIVKDDGDVLCYHLYDRNRFEDYLFYNAYLERASTKRHEYATINKEEDGSLTFSLNLQIRMK